MVPRAADQIERTREALFPSRRVDDEIEAFADRLSGVCRRDAQLSRDRELRHVPSEHRDVIGDGAQHLRDQQSESSIADDRDARATFNRDLLEDAAGGRDRLDEHGRAVLNRVGHFVQVRGRERHELGEGAGAAANAHHRSLGAVLFHAGAAQRAAAAADVDLAHDALADPAAIRSRRLIDHANELVSRDALERRVAFEQLKIGAADACHPHADAALVCGVLKRNIAQAECSVGQDNRAHLNRFDTEGTAATKGRP